jgi:hypothetical protein
MNVITPLSSDQRETVQHFLTEAIAVTEKRLQELEMDPMAVLDPDDPFPKQVVILRRLFLMAEQLAVRFSPLDGNYWRVLLARLQPICVAYQAHARFQQNFLLGTETGSDEALVEIYRERLMNSERFRKIFFELKERVDDGEFGDEPGFQPRGRKRPQYKTEDDTADIQSRVLTELEGKLRQMERREEETQLAMHAQYGELETAKIQASRLQQQLEKLEKDHARLKEETVSIRLAAEAAKGKKKTDVLGAIDDIISDSGEVAPADWQAKIESMQKEIDTTASAAYNAYMASSDMSIVILFMLTSFRVSTYEKLGTEVAKAITTFGVKPTVHVVTETGPKYFQGSSTISNAESLIEGNRGKGRVVEEGNYLVIYEDKVTLLASNMPVNDRDRYERLKDNMSTLMKGAAARAEAIALASAAEKQKLQIERLVVRSDEVFKGVTKNLEKQSLKVVKLMRIAGQDLRAGLGVVPGDPKSMLLTSRMKKLEDMLLTLFDPDELMDPAFAKNVARVAASLRDKDAK